MSGRIVMQCVTGFIISLISINSLYAAETAFNGNTQGNFAVSSSGAATYSIPIEVPPGINGLQPNLSLNYNSQGGNGLLGVGWSLGGISAITRCPKTFTQDGGRARFTLEPTDHYCLDGQRLVPADGNYDDYGANGKEYRTEIDTFSKIISYDQTEYGPQYFKVWTPSGSIMEYGVSFESRSSVYINAGGRKGQTPNINWSINKITDSSNNEMVFNYYIDTGTGDHRIFKISYHYTNSTPGMSVVFTYESRIDTQTNYIEGAKSTIAFRLNGIETRLNGNISYENKYNLIYDPNQGTGTDRSRIEGIQECNQTSCKGNLDIAWLQEINSNTKLGQIIDNPVPDSQYLGHSDGTKRLHIADFNGDGKADILTVGNVHDAGKGLNNLYLSNGQGFDDAIPVSAGDEKYLGHSNQTQRLHIADFNGDGMADLLNVGDMHGKDGTVPEDDGGYNNLYISNGHGFNDGITVPIEKGYYLGHSNHTQRVHVADFNGDGLADLLNVADSGGDSNNLYLSKGVGFHPRISDPVPGSNYLGHSDGTKRLHVADYNGDGMADLLNVGDEHGAGGGLNNLYLSNGNGFNTAISVPVDEEKYLGHSNQTQRLHIADFNGDGMADLLNVGDMHGKKGNTPGDNGGYNNLYISNGHGFNSGITVSVEKDFYLGHSNRTQRVYVADFNGDGMADLLNVADAHNDGWDANNLYLANGFDFNSKIPDPIPDSKHLGHSNNTQRVHIADFDGDGFPDLLNVTDAGSSHTIYFNNSKSQVISNIATNAGIINSINYMPITDNSIYTKYTNQLDCYPTCNIQAPLYVVSSVQSNNGIDGTNTTSYEYEGAKVHKRGRGFLGFAKQIKTNEQTGISLATTFSQTYPYTGRVVNTTQTLTDGTVLSATDNEFSHYGVANNVPVTSVHVYNSKSTVKLHETDGTHYKTEITEVLTEPDYGLYGQAENKEVVKITSHDGLGGGLHVIETENEIALPEAYGLWQTGNVTKTTITATKGSDVSIKETRFEYIQGTGQLKWQKEAPGETVPYDANTYLFTKFDYHPNGNTWTVTVSGDSTADNPITARTTTKTYNYDNSAYPVVTVTNNLSEVETQTYDARWGKILTITDEENNITSSWSYNSFGRKASETILNGTLTTTWDYFVCDSNALPLCETGEAYFHRIATTGSAPTTIFYDILGREIRKVSTGFANTQIAMDTVFNALGKVEKQSRNYVVGTANASKKWVNYQYDDIGRTEEILAADGSKTTLTYAGLTTTTQKERNGINGLTTLTTVQQTNPQDKLIKATDSNLKDTVYEYDAFLNSKTITDSQTNVIETDHDSNGRRTRLKDPDMGEWFYEYDAIGNLRKQTDAEGQATLTTYDTLNRLLTQTDVVSGEVGVWAYYKKTDAASGRCVGKLKSITRESDNYSETFTYDNLCRADTSTTIIESTPYTVKTQYDSKSRLSLLHYPSSGSQGTFVKRNVYDDNGYLLKIQDGTVPKDTPNVKIYWEGFLANPDGDITLEQIGGVVTTTRVYDSNTGLLTKNTSGANNALQNHEYKYDTLGNLEQRIDHNEKYINDGSIGVTETFNYDNLNRLKTVHRNEDPSPYRSLQYDDLGNITSKSDVGAYQYDQVSNAGPHAVTSVNGSANFTYDKNGSMLTGRGRTIGYTAFSKPSSISQVGASTNFIYGPDRSRIKNTTTSSEGTSTIHYIGKLFERNVKSTGNTEYKNYIYAGGELVGIDTRRSNNTKELQYTLKDHLGSISVLFNEVGGVDKRYSYDPFGKQRSFALWNDGFSAEVVSNLTSNHTRGFTGHEMLNEVGLIHMNGRVYDPVLGRFVSADPFIQFAGFSQSYNRYSYVLNNPLSFTDPSGFSAWTKYRGWVKITVGIIMVVADALCDFCTGGLLASAGITLIMDGTCEVGWGGCAEAEARKQDGAVSVSIDFGGESEDAPTSKLDLSGSSGRAGDEEETEDYFYSDDYSVYAHNAAPGLFDVDGEFYDEDVAGINVYIYIASGKAWDNYEINDASEDYYIKVGLPLVAGAVAGRYLLKKIAEKKLKKELAKGGRRTKHTDNRHIDRKKYPEKSKFKKPNQVDKISKKTLRSPDRVVNQRNRIRVEKDLGRDIGTRGERTNVTVIDKVTGKRVTQFPK